MQFYAYVYNATAACTGLSVSQYFKLMVNVWNKYNVDVSEKIKVFSWSAKLL